METITNNLIALMERFPSLRNSSDTRLCKHYARHVDKVYLVVDIKTNFDTITRCRRKLVEKDPEKYAPTMADVRYSKSRKEQSIKDWSKL